MAGQLGGYDARQSLALGSWSCGGACPSIFALVGTPFEFGVPFIYSYSAYATADQNDFLAFAGEGLYDARIFGSSVGCDIFQCPTPALAFAGSTFNPDANTPEPGTWLMLLGGIGALTSGSRRQQH
jgi:hypothetical protein